MYIFTYYMYICILFELCYSVSTIFTPLLKSSMRLCVRLSYICMYVYSLNRALIEIYACVCCE